MKKKLLQKQRGIFLALLSFLCVISIQAQTWTAPTFEHQSDDLSSHVGEAFYLYNVGLSAYVTYGAEYGTRSVMGPVGYPMYLRASGSNYKFEFVTSSKHNGVTYDLFDAGSGTVYTDNTTNSDWACTYDGTSKSYTVANTVALTKYLAPNSATYSNTPANTAGNGFKNGGKYYTLMDNYATNDNYAKWRFVTPKQKALLDLSNLFTYVTNNPSLGIILTSYVDIYNNSASTTNDLTTDLTNLKNAIYATATTSNPVEITSFAIANPSFEFKSSGSMDSWVVTTGSLQPQYNNTFSSGLTGSVEYYSGTGNIPAFTIQQTINSLPAGKYSLSTNLTGSTGTGTTSPANIKLFAGSYNTSITTTPTPTPAIYSVQDILCDGSALNIGLQYTTGAAWLAADYFKLYYYGPVPIVSTSKSSFAFSGDADYVSDNLTVTGIILSDPISISAPAGITVSPTTLDYNASNATVTVTYDGTTSVNGNITFTSGSTSTNVAVTGIPTCYTPLYPSGNLVTDPKCNTNIYNGWNTNKFSIVTGSLAYCGSSVRISGAASPGSLDYVLTGKVTANTTYRFKAMIYTDKIAQITLDGFTTPTIPLNTSYGAWHAVDFIFTTGTLGAKQGIYINSAGLTNGATDIRLDNYEIYKVPGIRVAEASVPVMSSAVGSSDSKTIKVSGNGLTDAVSLVLSGANADQFSVSPTTLPIVAADSITTTTVSITYTPTGASMSHVATLTLSSPGAADKTFVLSASSSATGVRPVSSIGSVSVFNRTLKVEGSQSIEVFTAQGLRIAQSKVNNESFSIVLTPGIYIVKLDAGVKKVVVK